GAMSGSSLDGGKGDDTYVIDSNHVQIVEMVGNGYDTVMWNSYDTDAVLADNVEKLVFDVGGDINAIGNAAGNWIVANNNDNTLYGASGDDVLSGQGGDDILDGGAGNDEMSGGDGNDHFFVDASGDVVADSS